MHTDAETQRLRPMNSSKLSTVAHTGEDTSASMARWQVELGRPRGSQLGCRHSLATQVHLDLLCTVIYCLCVAPAPPRLRSKLIQFKTCPAHAYSDHHQGILPENSCPGLSRSSGASQADRRPELRASYGVAEKGAAAGDEMEGNMAEWAVRA
jgi:hypothetical protein